MSRTATSLTMSPASSRPAGKGQGARRRVRASPGPPPPDAPTPNILDEIRPLSRQQLSRAVRQAIARSCAPPPKRTVSEWADAKRMLSPEASSEPGRWSTERVAPAKGVMDAFSDPEVEKVSVMACTQVFKTESLNNVVANFIDQDPSPIMVLQPTLTMAEAWSKDRLVPMLRDTPALQGLVENKSKASENTILHKTFPGGHITMAGANSPASLASRPIRVVLCDEVDRYPPSAGKEGDPVSLVVERTETFWNRKIGLFSTPTVKGKSRIEASYNESDQRRFFVPCPHCGERHPLKWTQVKWEEGQPETAAYWCESCGCKWSEAERLRAIRCAMSFPDRGWRQTAEFSCCGGEKRTPSQWDDVGHSLCPGCGKRSRFDGHAGFHLNKLASPWTTIPKIVKKFLESKPFPDRLKTWVNTTLAETWEESGETVDATGLLSRREHYAADPVPAWVLLITAGADIQPDRFEVEILGHGLGEQTWSLDYVRHYGDPSTQAFWEALDDVLERRFKHPCGRELRIETACVDSGDNTQLVYDFCRPRFGRRIYAIKGRGGPHPIWPEQATVNKGKKIAIFLLGVDTAKSLIYKRLSIRGGPGCCHFPTRYSETYFEQLTAEKAITKHRNGFPYTVWEKSESARNEALDCRVYAMAARYSLTAIDLDRRAALLSAPPPLALPPADSDPPTPPPPPKPKPPPRQRYRSRGIRV